MDIKFYGQRIHYNENEVGLFVPIEQFLPERRIPGYRPFNVESLKPRSSRVGKDQFVWEINLLHNLASEQILYGSVGLPAPISNFERSTRSRYVVAGGDVPLNELAKFTQDILNSLR